MSSLYLMKTLERYIHSEGEKGSGQFSTRSRWTELFYDESLAQISQGSLVLVQAVKSAICHRHPSRHHAGRIFPSRKVSWSTIVARAYTYWEARCTARSPSIIITKVLQTRRRVKTIRISHAGNYDVVKAMPRLLLRLLSSSYVYYACSQRRQYRYYY